MLEEMPLEKLTAMNIVHEVGMSGRPEFYSGRGAILTDLDSSLLTKIHDLIKREHGDDASKNFVEMVVNMKNLSASDFLTCLYHLESSDWKYSGFQSDLPGGIAVAKDREGRYDAFSGMMGAMDAIFVNRSGRDETEMIRNPFLEEIGYEPKPGSKKRRFSNNAGYTTEEF